MSVLDLNLVASLGVAGHPEGSGTAQLAPLVVDLKLRSDTLPRRTEYLRKLSLRYSQGTVHGKHHAQVAVSL